jgi:fructose-bisphosphate aldolase class I
MSDKQLQLMKTGSGFIAALDQSGGSTPKALGMYGVAESAYSNEEEMYDAVHAMRTRIMTNEHFVSGDILAAILFQNTLDKTVEGLPTSQYLWGKNILPILKIDLGLADEQDKVQLMKPIPGMGERLDKAKALDVFGTKMRSVIKDYNASGIARIVAQQFEVGKEILSHGLIPIIEPEVDINSPNKKACEEALRAEIHKQLDALEGDQPVMFKLTLPEEANYYREFIGHPKVLRVVALSGGYSREVANDMLSKNNGMIASFSRALTEGLHADQSDAEYSQMIGKTIASICAASAT